MTEQEELKKMIIRLLQKENTEIYSVEYTFVQSAVEIKIDAIMKERQK